MNERSNTTMGKETGGERSAVSGSKSATVDVAVIGLGYVGLPLSLQFARSGMKVLGLDIDPNKVAELNAGRSYIKHVGSDLVQAVREAERLEASTDFSRVGEAGAVMICVPTPLDRNREPDISYVLQTGGAIAPHLSRGALVVLESTTYPGTTDTDLRRVLEEGSGLKAGEDFHLAFSPEREDPGNPASEVGKVPKLVGGYTPACLEKAMAIYGRAIENPVAVSSCRVAEAGKLLENIFRSVNIALVNELKVIYEVMGIDVWEVIDAAKTKPFGFMAFYPGPGLGGHCIPIDPFYLTWKAREYSQNTRFLELAGEVNTGMPGYVMTKVVEALNSRKLAVNGAKVLILGLAYKPDVADERESPSYVLMERLSRAGAEVSYHDPHIPVIQPTREHGRWAGTKSIEWKRETIEGYDLVLIATAHRCVNYEELAEWARCIVDTRNVMKDVKTAAGQVWKA